MNNRVSVSFFGNKEIKDVYGFLMSVTGENKMTRKPEHDQVSGLQFEDMTLTDEDIDLINTMIEEINDLINDHGESMDNDELAKAELNLKALEMAKGDKWMDISTAPQYTAVLTYEPSDETVTEIIEIATKSYDGVWDCKGYKRGQYEPTHWMPLPKPPKSEG